MMTPPPFNRLLRNKIRNMLDASVLWHLAECGTAGASTVDLVRHTREPHGTVSLSCRRLERLGLLFDSPKPGPYPNQWHLSRLGYALMTGHAQPAADTLQPIAAAT